MRFWTARVVHGSLRFCLFVPPPSLFIQVILIINSETTLRLDDNQGAQLPASVGKLTGLKRLELTDCTQVQRLPASIGKLTGLETLVLAGCSGLRELDLAGFCDLKELNLRGCSGMKYLHLLGCTGLERLDLWDCTGLETLGLLGCSNLWELDEEVSKCHGLIHIDLRDCKNLLFFPDLGRCSKLDGRNIGVHGCSSLRPVPVDHLPLNVRRAWYKADLDPKEALAQAMTAISWIAILLATASFVGFATVPQGPSGDGQAAMPGGPSDDGQVGLSPSSSPPDPRDPFNPTSVFSDPAEGPAEDSIFADAFSPPPSAFSSPSNFTDGTFSKPNYHLNYYALRSYFICNMLTFLFAITTALFVVAQNMPQKSPAMSRLLFNIGFASILLIVALLFGVATFLSGAFAMYPLAYYQDMWAAVIAPGVLLVAIIIYFVLRLYKFCVLWYIVERALPAGFPAVLPEIRYSH